MKQTGLDSYDPIRKILHERIVQNLCGPKYSRRYPYRRGSSYTKTLVTGLGTIGFKVKRVISRADNSVSVPILEALDVKRRKSPEMYGLNLQNSPPK